MALPTSYLTSTKNLAAILEALQNAQAPDRVTQKFIEDLGFKSPADRLIINLLKSLGLLSDTGNPLQAYHQFLDKSEGKRVLADGIRKAYADLFQLNKNAQNMSKADVQAKMKTLSQGQHGDAVLSKMATTFKAVAALADFTGQPSDMRIADDRNGEGEGIIERGDTDVQNGFKVGGLVYNINLHLPESRDPAVYDALFRSFKEHLG